MRFLRLIDVYAVSLFGISLLWNASAHMQDEPATNDNVYFIEPIYRSNDLIKFISIQLIKRIFIPTPTLVESP